MAKINQEIEVVIKEIQNPAIQNQELTIVRMSEPIPSTEAFVDPICASDVFPGAVTDNLSPASLDADLKHYKELFAKLRFSYIEQVTKEKFLRAIVGDPPQIVEHQENVELDAQLVASKADLKLQKKEVAGIIEKLRIQGDDLSRRYEKVSQQTNQVTTLPEEIALIQATFIELLEQHTITFKDPSMGLSLPATVEMLATRADELYQTHLEVQKLTKTISQNEAELDRLAKEYEPMEARNSAIVSNANEAKRKREDNDERAEDHLELMARRYRGIETTLTDIIPEGKTLDVYEL